MAKCVITIEDIGNGNISISGASDPEIKTGEQMTFAQTLTVDLMRGFRSHFEPEPTAKPETDEGLN